MLKSKQLTTYLIASFSVALFLVLATYARAQTGCLKGACFNSAFTTEKRELPLVGIGAYRYYLLTGYVAAWYASQSGVFPLSDDAPYALTIHYFYSIDAKDIIDAAEVYLTRQQGDLTKFRERLNTLNKSYRSVVPGDRYTLRYQPSEGLSLLYNNTLLVTIPGKDFADAYLQIWLHPTGSLSPDLREALLNLSS